MIPKLRVLGEALCFVLIVPVLLLALFGYAVKHASPSIEAELRFLLFALCGVSQIIASVKLRARRTWDFGLAKFGSYVLDVVALILLFLFTEITFIAGYYILYPNTPPLFGGN